MSVNVNRKKLEKANNNREYNLLNKYYEIDWDYGWNLKSCGLFSSEVRQYKTWKHNRRTQYKS